MKNKLIELVELIKIQKEMFAFMTHIKNDVGITGVKFAIVCLWVGNWLEVL